MWERERGVESGQSKWKDGEREREREKGEGGKRR